MYTVDKVSDIICKNIRSMRQKRGLTQEQLSDVLGKSRVWVNFIESGRTKPTIISLYEIANALHCSIYELIPDSTAQTDTLTGAWNQVDPAAQKQILEQVNSAEGGKNG